jgi:hypothetical protein
MRKFILFLLALFVCICGSVSAQEKAVAFFLTPNDTLSKSSKDMFRVVQVTLPFRQKKFHGATVTVQLNKEKTNIPEQSIAISSITSATIDSTKAKILQVKVFFTRNESHERTMAMKLTATDKKGKPIQQDRDGAIEYELYIEPYQENTTPVATAPGSAPIKKDRVKAYFTMSKLADTLVSSVKGNTKTVEFIAPKQKNFAGAKVSVKIDNAGTNLPDSAIALSSQTTLTVDSTDDKKLKVKLSFDRNTHFDRMIRLKLSAVSKTDDPLTLIDSAISYDLYIQPYKESEEEKKAGQIKAFFDPVKAEVSDKLEDTIKTVKVIIPKQPKFHKSRVTVSVDVAKSTLPLSDIRFPPTNVSTITTDSTKNDTVSMTFTINRTEKKHEKVIVLKLIAQDSNGVKLELPDSATTWTLSYTPSNGDSLRNNNNEYWFFTGTNIDLLDGFKPKELYFKGSFLFPIYPKDPKKDLLYLTFEKNRYFNERDSLYRIPLSDRVFVAGQPDTLMTMVRGQYNSWREVVTENVALNLAYLWNFDRTPKTNYNFYGVGGFSVDYQTVKTSYEHMNIVSDTQVVRRRDTIVRPLLTRDKFQQWGASFYTGLMFIHSGEDVNLKVFWHSGINIFHSPASRVRNSTTEFVKYQTTKRLYSRIRLDATLVASPGISIGGEMFFRSGEKPLFNFTVSKVFDYRQIASLFGKMPSLK